MTQDQDKNYAFVALGIADLGPNIAVLVLESVISADLRP
jgi:hypothetical protein